MFEKYMICTRGFKNVSENDQITGFQLKVRITYYRGIPLSCLDRFDVTVDGETFGPEKMTYTVGDRAFTPKEAENAVNVRWFFGDPITLTIRKPGGLKPGTHDLQVIETLRISYMPNSRSVAQSRRKVTLVV